MAAATGDEDSGSGEATQAGRGGCRVGRAVAGARGGGRCGGGSGSGEGEEEGEGEGAGNVHNAAQRSARDGWRRCGGGGGSARRPARAAWLAHRAGRAHGKCCAACAPASRLAHGGGRRRIMRRGTDPALAPAPPQLRDGNGRLGPVTRQASRSLRTHHASGHARVAGSLRARDVLVTHRRHASLSGPHTLHGCGQRTPHAASARRLCPRAAAGVECSVVRSRALAPQAGWLTGPDAPTLMRAAGCSCWARVPAPPRPAPRPHVPRKQAARRRRPTREARTGCGLSDAGLALHRRSIPASGRPSTTAAVLSAGAVS